MAKLISTKSSGIQNEARFVVTTLNSHYGRTLSSERGLDPVSVSDVLMLQEVIQTSKDLKALLRAANFLLAAYEPKFGLAIALRADSDFKIVPGSFRSKQLSSKGRFERRISQTWAKAHHDFFARGVVAVKLEARNGRTVTVADVHPSTWVTPAKREAEIKLLEIELLDSYYSEDPLVIGGDWNHAEKPTRADLDMRQSAALSEVDVAGQPTWYANESRLFMRTVATTLALAKGRPSLRNAHFDSILYRGTGLEADSEQHAEVVRVKSDHRAIVSRFRLQPAD